MSLAKGRQCSDTCQELLVLELVHFYSRQAIVPPAAALEAIGLRVGRQLAERYTAARARLAEPLDVIKFICKDFWIALFRKQVDNLRTNHRGTYVLKDGAFRWLSKLSLDVPLPGEPPPATSAADVARSYLVLPCALIRGALTHLGVEASVEADPAALPGVDFTIVVQPR